MKKINSDQPNVNGVFLKFKNGLTIEGNKSIEIRSTKDGINIKSDKGFDMTMDKWIVEGLQK